MKIIALDIGSSFSKAAILDTESESMEHLLRRPTPARDASKPQDCFECDPLAILSLAKALIDALIQREGHVSGIYISTQMHGVILEKDGKPVTPYLTWQDTRAQRQQEGVPLLEIIRQRIGEDAISHMGTRYKAGLALCSLTGYQKEHPIDLSGVKFHTLGSFLIAHLGQESRHACHITDAAATGFCHAEQGDWNRGTIEAMGDSELTFPEIVPETQSQGHYRGIPLYPAIGDHQASVHGVCGSLERRAILTVGTAGIVCAVSDEKSPVPTMELRPFFSGKTLLTLTRQPGGRAVDVIIGLFSDAASLLGQELSSQRAFEILLSKEQQDRQLLVMPDFYSGQGEGQILKISPKNFNLTELFYATLDGLADSYAHAIARMEPHAGRFEGVLLSGGKLAKSEALRCRVQRATGLPTICSQREDEALWGLMEIAKKNPIGA